MATVQLWVGGLGDAGGGQENTEDNRERDQGSEDGGVNQREGRWEQPGGAECHDEAGGRSIYGVVSLHINVMETEPMVEENQLELRKRGANVTLEIWKWGQGLGGEAKKQVRAEGD